MIHGVMSTILVGMVGAFLAELIRILPAVRSGKPPRGWELLASGIQVLLGAGAVLFGWEAQSALQVAVTGAAFPLLFSAAVDGAKPPADGGSGRDVAFGGRSASDYLAGRY
jgi:tetrahydromethanopterin S-methyltransferase subunit E